MEQKRIERERDEQYQYSFAPKISKNSAAMAKKLLPFKESMTVEQRLLHKGKAYESKLKTKRLQDEAESTNISREKFLSKESKRILHDS